MRIDRIDLKLVRLPLVRPFRTSSSFKNHLDHILIRLTTDEGLVGWGESASPSDPYYCPETSETCWHLLKDFLGPLVIGRPWETIDDLLAYQALVKGNNFAKAGLEMAAWDLLSRRDGMPLSRMLGGGRAAVLQRATHQGGAKCAAVSGASAHDGPIAPTAGLCLPNALLRA